MPPRGSRHGSAKLGDALVVKMRRQGRADGLFLIAAAARRHRVTYRAIKDALTGATYAHLDRKARPYFGPSRKPGQGSTVRIDSDSTHGWQARYRGASKFFSDGIHGKSALPRARAWLRAERE